MSGAAEERANAARVMSFVGTCWSLKVETLHWLMAGRLSADETDALLVRMAKRRELAIVRDGDGELAAMTMKNALRR